VRVWVALLLGVAAAASFGAGTLLVEGAAGTALQVAGLVLALYVGVKYTDGAVLP